MQIRNIYPPNYADIKYHLNPPLDALFCFGSTLYNPSGQEVPEDVFEHELVHEAQMRDWRPEAWWKKYLLDSEFRKSMEVEAYAAQYKWVRDRVKDKYAKMCLSTLANNLSVLYDLDITHSQAETLIRKANSGIFARKQ